MANVLVQESSLQAIANAIRNKNGSQDTYTPAMMAAAIDSLEPVDKDNLYNKYLYYRLYITCFSRNNADNQTFQNIAGFLVIAGNGVDLARKYGVEFTAVSVVAGGSVMNAFDGNPETLWESDWSGSPNTIGWVQVKLDEPRAACGFILYSRAEQRDYPREAELQGSMDGESWDTLYTINESTVPRSAWTMGSQKGFLIRPNENSGGEEE